MAAVPGGLAGLIDTRTLGRPPVYTGTTAAEFTEWEFVLKTYLNIISDEFGHALTVVENATDDQEPALEMDALPARQRE
eukprot:8650568-Alexandrium_andersonii.AAC.1